MGTSHNTEVYRRGIAGRFGLKLGQLTGGVIYLAVWYSQTGWLLGWGDLDARQIEQIARELGMNELFVVVPPEEPAKRVVYLIPSHGGAVISEGYVFPHAEHLSMEALAARAVYVIAKGHVYFVDRDRLYADGQEISQPSSNGRALRAVCIKPERALRMIAKANFLSETS